MAANIKKLIIFGGQVQSSAPVDSERYIGELGSMWKRANEEVFIWILYFGRFYIPYSMRASE